MAGPIEVASTIGEMAGLLVKGTSSFVAEVRDLSSMMVELIDSATEELRILRTKEVLMCTDHLLALNSMRQVCDDGYRVVDAARDLVWFLTPSRLKRISAQARENNYKPLQDLLVQMDIHLTHTEDSFQSFTRSSGEAGSNTSKSAVSCREAGLNASRKRNKIQIGGGTGSAFGFLAGIGLTAGAIVAGIFSAGVGTVVVLGVGAGVGATAGAVGAGVTSHLAKGYQTAATALQTLAEKFDTLCLMAFQIQESLLDLKRICDSLRKNHTTTHLCLDSSLSGESISRVIDLLAFKVEELSSEMEASRSRLAAKRDELARQISKK